MIDKNLILLARIETMYENLKELKEKIMTDIEKSDKIDLAETKLCLEIEAIRLKRTMDLLKEVF